MGVYIDINNGTIQGVTPLMACAKYNNLEIATYLLSYPNLKVNAINYKGETALDILDDYVLTSNINEVGGLGLISRNISDLTGIEGFRDLLNLDLSGNQLQVGTMSLIDTVAYNIPQLVYDNLNLKLREKTD